MTDCKAGSSVYEASSRVFFCEGGRGLSWLRAWCSLTICVCVTVASCSLVCGYVGL